MSRFRTCFASARISRSIRCPSMRGRRRSGIRLDLSDAGTFQGAGSRLSRDTQGQTLTTGSAEGCGLLLRIEDEAIAATYSSVSSRCLRISILARSNRSLSTPDRLAQTNSTAFQIRFATQAWPIGRLQGQRRHPAEPLQGRPVRRPCEGDAGSPLRRPHEYDYHPRDRGQHRRAAAAHPRRSRLQGPQRFRTLPLQGLHSGPEAARHRIHQTPAPPFSPSSATSKASTA